MTNTDKLRELYALKLQLKNYKGEGTEEAMRDISTKIHALQNEECDEHYYSDNESRWFKEYYAEPFTESEKQEYIEGHWHTVHSPYDCSGEWFTNRIVICNISTSFGAKSVIYTFESLDV